MEASLINIIVRFASGVALPHSVDEKMTVGEFKKHLMTRESLQDVEVFFDGKRLEDDSKTLRDCKIGKEAIVEAKTKQLLRVVCESDCVNVLRGVSSKVNLVFKIETGEAEKLEKRAPINLCLVLDHSGSMGGDKMTNSRSAIKEVIDAMDKEDSLSFVIYDDKAKIVFENGDLSTAASKAELKALVDRVNAEGGTNIGCGLNLGAKVLNLPGFEGIAGNLIASASAAVKKLVGSNSSDDARPKRLFLFSDGQTGERNLPALAASIKKAGAAVSSFGLGNDFNESLMTSISEAGGGTFCYIAQPKLINEYVGDALGSLMLLIGTNAKLEVRGVGTGVVKKIYDHTSNTADLKDLRQKNMVQVVCELEVSPSDATPAGPSAEWTLSFDDSKTKAPQKLTGSVSLPFVSSKDELKTNPDAVSIVLTIQAAVLDAEVLKALDAGKKEEAVRVKKQQAEMLSSAVSLSARNNFAPTALAACQKTEKVIQSSNASRARKAAANEGYQSRQQNFSAQKQMAAYVMEEEDDVPSISRRSPSPTNVSPVRRTSRSPSPTKVLSRPAADAPSAPPQQQLQMPQQQQQMQMPQQYFRPPSPSNLQQQQQQK